MKLTPHFSWQEVTASPTAKSLGIDNTVPAALEANVRRTADRMEQVRDLLGVPLRVTSWYRAPALNAAIGGSKTSAHMQGLAVDFKPIGMPLAEAFERIARSPLAFDQLIEERTKSGAKWIHFGLSTGPYRRDVLQARGAVLGGKMTYTRVRMG